MAVSGGVDSMVLLHGLLQHALRFNLKLHVAHVHHGWRKESDIEYEAIEELCKIRGIDFFGTHLNLSINDPNAENTARDARRAFLNQISLDLGAQGCFMAHHKQDLQETVLKRLFEGAHLEHLSGMEKVIKHGELTFFRPFLDLDKTTLYQYASDHKVRFFEDKTNMDPSYLRGKMRQSLIPELQRQFGKNIGESLTHLASESSLMKDYFKKRARSEIKVLESGNEAFILKFPKSLEIFEIRHLLLAALEERGRVFSRQIVGDLTFAMLNSLEPVDFKSGDWEVRASRGIAYVYKEEAHIDFSYFSKQELENLPKWMIKNRSRLQKV